MPGATLEVFIRFGWRKTAWGVLTNTVILAKAGIQFSTPAALTCRRAETDGFGEMARHYPPPLPADCGR